MFPHPIRYRYQGLCLAVLASLVVSLWSPSAAQLTPPAQPFAPPGSEIDQQAQAIALQEDMDPQLVAAMLEAGIPPEDVGPELLAEWPAHLRRLTKRAARSRAQPAQPDVVTPELEHPAEPASGLHTDEVQRLWLEIEVAHSAGNAQHMADLAAQLPPSEWIAAARLLQEIAPLADRPPIQPTGLIPAQEEERQAQESEAQRAALQQAEAVSRAADLVPDLEPEKLATPAGAQDGQGGEAIRTVGDSCTYATLQAAVDAAVSGDTIRVQGRTYTGAAATVNINAKSLSIYGGYNSTCTVQGTTKTVLNAAGAADSVFEIYGGAGPLTVMIDNFEITGGENDANFGGAIEIDNQFTVTLSRTLLHNNRSNNGGGVHMSAGTTFVIQNGSLLYLNEALTGNGGGINCTGGSVTVTGDSYVGFWLIASLGNSAAGNGGGVYLDDCDLSLDGNSAAAARVMYNSAANGGGIYATNNAYVAVTGGSAAVNNNQILSATGKGGGLYLAGGSDLYVDNGQVNGNTADETGAGIYATDTGTVVDFDSSDSYFCTTPKCAQLSNNVNTGLYGGGISLEFGATLDMESVYVEGNQTSYMGSAIYARREGTSVTLDSVMVTGNQAGNDQVIRLFDRATSAVQSSTVADNTGHTTATFGVEDTTQLDGDGLVVWGNDGSTLVTGAGVATLDCSVMQAAYSGSNNVVADPQFMDGAGGDYHIAHSSPAIDHCNSGFSRDIDYELRPIDVPGVGAGTYDAGADEANAFVGLNGTVCAFPSIGSAITAAASGDTIYMAPGVYPERLGLVNKNLTFVAATGDCSAETTGGVTIDANDAAATWGGVAEIGSGRTVTFRNLTLTDGTAQYGGILYVNSSAQVVLDNTDLTHGSAATTGGGLRAILGATIELINGSRIIRSATTGTGDGAGAAVYQATLILRGDSRIGDYLEGNSSADQGGGVFLDGGLLQMYDTSRVRSNVATADGGGVYASNGADVELHNSADIGWTTTTSNNDAVNGGGVYLTGSGTNLSLSDDSGVQNNYASNYGGGIYASAGASVVIDSALVNANEAGVRAGALVIDGTATATVRNGSNVNDNLSNDLGGGIYLQGDGGVLIIDASHVDNNTANGWFGGMRVYGNGTLTLRNGATVNGNNALGTSGGGLGIYLGTANIDNAAIQSNIAAVNGGGIYMDNSALLATEPDIHNNTATGGNGGGIYAVNSPQVDLDRAEFGYAGNGNRAPAGDGGGVYLDNSTLSADNSLFRFNEAGDDGGAVAAVNGSVVTIFSSMTAPSASQVEGPAARLPLASPCDPAALAANVYCSMLHNNSALDHGGALHFEGESSGVIDHSALLANSAATGSALELYDSDVTLRHSRVSGNTASGVNNSTVHVYNVGGVGPTSTFDALHNTFASNTHYAVYYAAGTSGAFDNNIVWGNGHPGVITPNATATCNDTQGGALTGATNISVNPSFITTPRGDYHLAPASPAMDACAAGGSPDQDNVARPKGVRYDMGAFELWCASGVTDVNGSGSVDIVDIQRVAGDWNDPSYLPPHDIDCDGDVDVNDIIAVAGDWTP